MFLVILAIAISALLYVALVLIMAMNNSTGKGDWYYSKYQSYSDAFNDYQACKAQAPKGFDCVMVPLMVSEEYIKEQSHD